MKALGVVTIVDNVMSDVDSPFILCVILIKAVVDQLGKDKNILDESYRRSMVRVNLAYQRLASEMSADECEDSG